VNGIARAALVHLWFESIHLVEDGNGRPGRALADMALAQNLHAQDPQASQAVVRDATDKAQCRLRTAQSQTNERQRKVLARLLEAGHVGSGGGFELAAGTQALMR
jgi:Fic/DOC family